MANYSLPATAQLVNKVTRVQMCSFNVLLSMPLFHITVAELSGYQRGCMDHKPNISIIRFLKRYKNFIVPTMLAQAFLFILKRKKNKTS